MMLAWTKPQWEKLWRAQCEQRLPHALMFYGMAGLGKAMLAQHFVQANLCLQVSSDGTSCEPAAKTVCHACRLVNGRSHPNVLWIEPEKPGQAIKVDQIRSLNEFVQQTALQDSNRFVIINPAHAMNANAANALLKTLEEPQAGAILILVCHEKGLLPATIVSRCQRVMFTPPTKTQAIAWLKSAIPEDQHKSIELALRLTHQAPLRALQLLEENVLLFRENLLQLLESLQKKQVQPIQAASTLQLEPLPFLDYMLAWIIDLLRLQQGCDDAEIINQDFFPFLCQLKQCTRVQENTQFMVYLQELRILIARGINLNKQLLMENILIRWAMLMQGSRHDFS